MIQCSEIQKRQIEKAPGHCDVHGAFVGYRMRDSDTVECPQCFEDRLHTEIRERAFRDRVANLERVSGVPVRYAGLGFSSFTQAGKGQAQAVSEVTGFFRAVLHAARGGQAWRTLVLVGDVGSGKTHLVCALANNLVKRGISARYTTVFAMLSDIKRAYGSPGLSESGQISRYVDDPDLLVIDELDVSRGTENDLGLIFAVVNGRYNAGKPVAVVSNQPMDGLAAFIGDRTASRLAENMILVCCNWGDYRAARA